MYVCTLKEVAVTSMDWSCVSLSIATAFGQPCVVGSLPFLVSVNKIIMATYL